MNIPQATIKCRMSAIPGEVAMLLCVIADATCRGWVRAAAAKRGRPIGPYDLMLAGVALSWGMVMVTSHATEFIRIEGSLVEDWRQA